MLVLKAAGWAVAAARLSERLRCCAGMKLIVACCCSLLQQALICRSLQTARFPKTEEAVHADPRDTTEPIRRGRIVLWALGRRARLRYAKLAVNIFTPEFLTAAL